MLTLLKSLNCVRNAIYIIMISMIIKSMIIRLIILLIIIMINEEINERAIIMITKITKSSNLMILNSNRSLRILMY